VLPSTMGPFYLLFDFLFLPCSYPTVSSILSRALILSLLFTQRRVHKVPNLVSYPVLHSSTSLSVAALDHSCKFTF
jgi:hypothetical protein